VVEEVEEKKIEVVRRVWRSLRETMIHV